MPAPDRVHVHVLSDDERVREFARGLDPARYEVSFSSHRYEALVQVKKKPCDIAVIELELGGFGATKDLRALQTVRYIRVVMLCDRAHDRWLSLQAGADAVIVKPLQDLLQLQNAIELLLPVAT